MEIFQEIRKDHEHQKLIMKILVETSGNSESRRKHFDELKEALEVHESVERKHFYEPLKERAKTEDLSRNAQFEHHEISEKIEELDGLNMSSPAWIHKMKELRNLVLEHISEEERLLFDKADDVLTDAESKDLGADYIEEKRKIA